MNTESYVTHTIDTQREYYVVRAERGLEIRDRQTRTVLQVLEPPRDWGSAWLWTSSGFDGAQCVPLNGIRFIRTRPEPTPPTDDEPDQKRIPSFQECASLIPVP